MPRQGRNPGLPRRIPFPPDSGEDTVQGDADPEGAPQGPPQALGKGSWDWGGAQGSEVSATVQTHSPQPAQPCTPGRPPPAHPLPRGAPAPEVPPMSMALRFRALMMFTMMELAEGL